MKYYSYYEPYEEDDSIVDKVVMSEKEILDSYWHIWKDAMMEAGRSKFIDPKLCIENWCAVYWAHPEDIFRFKEGYNGKLFCIDDWDPNDLTFSLATIACVNDNSVRVPGYINIFDKMIRV